MNGPLTKLGIVRCRDLVQLYYGARMAAVLVQKNKALTTGTFVEIMSADPRRVRYEIIIENFDAAAQFVDIATPEAATSTQQQEYNLPPGSTLIIERDFTTDLDAVTIAVLANRGNDNMSISTRETILTPLPVDEPV